MLSYLENHIWNIACFIGSVTSSVILYWFSGSLCWSPCNATLLDLVDQSSQFFFSFFEATLIATFNLNLVELSVEFSVSGNLLQVAVVEQDEQLEELELVGWRWTSEHRYDPVNDTMHPVWISLAKSDRRSNSKLLSCACAVYVNMVCQSMQNMHFPVATPLAPVVWFT